MIGAVEKQKLVYILNRDAQVIKAKNYNPFNQNFYRKEVLKTIKSMEVKIMRFLTGTVNNFFTVGSSQINNICVSHGRR